MNSEQRALATLDLTLKNAFETLNKYSLWATTPDDEVTFNLVDAVPTLASKGTGIFLKPISIPSLAAIRSTIFGTAGTPSERPLYWNLNFLATKGWKFDRNSSSDNPVLSILVDTEIGSDSTAITINKRNFLENVFSGKYVLDESSEISLGDGVSLTNDKFLANLNLISLGNVNATSSLFGKSVTIGGTASTPALTFTHTTANNSTRNIVLVGANNANYETGILGGKLSLSAVFTKNYSSTIKNSSGNDIAKLLTAEYNSSNNRYNLFLGKWIYSPNAIQSLNIGDVRNLVISTSESLKLTAGGLKIYSSVDGAELHGTSTLTVYGDELTKVGSKTELDLGIVDDDGVMSKEVIIRKGSVEIPNLYVQKKANYHLSSIKHVSKESPNNSVKYIPSVVTKTSTSDTYAYEYTKNIKAELFDVDTLPLFDTVISDQSTVTGDYSYLFNVSSDAISVFRATVTVSSNNPVVTSEYVELTEVTGLSGYSFNTYASIVKAISTPNGIYLFVRMASGDLNVFYAQDCLNYRVIASYSMDFWIPRNFTVDYTSNGTADYIWFAVSYDADTRWYTTHMKYASAYTVGYLENNCLVVKTSTFTPTNGYGNAQVCMSVNPGSSDGKFALGTHTVKIKAFYDESTQKAYSRILGVFGCAYNRNGKFAGAFRGVGQLKYSFGGSYIESSEDFFIRYDGISDLDFLTVNLTANGGSAVAYTGASFISIQASSSVLSTTTSVISGALYAESELTYSIDGVKKRLGAIIRFDGSFLINESDSISGYVLSASTVSNKKSRIISHDGFVSYDYVTSSIKYIDYGANGVSVNVISAPRELTQNPSQYDIDSAVIDYFGMNYDSKGKFTSIYNLSVDGEDPFTLAMTDSSTDRANYVEEYDGDVSTIISSSEAEFTPTAVDSVLTINDSSSDSILVSMSNTYNSITKTSTTVPSVSDSTYSRKALNFSVEPISYLVKNRKTLSSSVKVGGSTITKNSSTVFEVSQDNTSLSGYRKPYFGNVDSNGDYIATTDQLNISNLAAKGTSSLDMNASSNKVYVTLLDSTCIVVSEGSDYKTSNILVRIPIRMLDPTDSNFDPSNSVVNEFNNVVSIKMSKVYGFRTNSCGRYEFNSKCNMILGLTEISEIGGGC